MLIPTQDKFSVSQVKQGGGFINKLIDKLPFELHLKNYNFAGPGTKLHKRLERGDKGINALDEACKIHDIAYDKYKDDKNRNIADKILIERAWERYKAQDSTLGEKAAALVVVNIMKMKTGSGIKTRMVKKINKKKTFGKALQNIKAVLRKHKSIDQNSAIKLAIKTAKSEMKDVQIGDKMRIIPIPKTGGALPFLIPLFAGLSALGGISGGVAGIVKTVKEISNAKKILDESLRHNSKMEAIALKKGNGLYLKPYKTGLGIYLRPFSKNL